MPPSLLYWFQRGLDDKWYFPLWEVYLNPTSSLLHFPRIHSVLYPLLASNQKLLPPRSKPLLLSSSPNEAEGFLRFFTGFLVTTKKQMGKNKHRENLSWTVALQSKILFCSEIYLLPTMNTSCSNIWGLYENFIHKTFHKIMKVYEIIKLHILRILLGGIRRPLIHPHSHGTLVL